jgi:hypothetical protein
VEKIYNEELRDLYYLPSIIRMIKSRRVGWAGHVARMVGNPEGRRPLERRCRTWTDNIRMVLGEIGWSDCSCPG